MHIAFTFYMYVLLFIAFCSIAVASTSIMSGEEEELTLQQQKEKDDKALADAAAKIEEDAGQVVNLRKALPEVFAGLWCRYSLSCLPP